MNFSQRTWGDNLTQTNAWSSRDLASLPGGTFCPD